MAVEGTRYNAEVAKENMTLNGIENVTVIHAVVGDVEGKDVIFSTTLNGSVSLPKVGETVKTVTIDALTAQHGVPDIVLLDIEGFEANALAGAVLTLAAGADFIIEVHEGCGLQHHATKERVLSFFPPNRYNCFISFPEGSNFHPYSAGAALPLGRFWLIAQFTPPPSSFHSDPV